MEKKMQSIGNIVLGCICATRGLFPCSPLLYCLVLHTFKFFWVVGMHNSSFLRKEKSSFPSKQESVAREIHCHTNKSLKIFFFLWGGVGHRATILKNYWTSHIFFCCNLKLKKTQVALFQLFTPLEQSVQYHSLETTKQDIAYQKRHHN